MKKVGAIIFVLVLAIVVLLLLNKKPAAQPNPISPAVVTDKSGGTNISVAAKAPPAAAAVATTVANQEISPSSTATAPTPEVAALPAATVLDNMRMVIHNYGATFGENPVGNNAEITAALAGKNPRQINFISGVAGLRVNENGELVDAYGTPFFFHQLSGKVMEIHSAGEDRKMWTFDDLVTK
jgi:hypothetical protein